MHKTSSPLRFKMQWLYLPLWLSLPIAGCHARPSVMQNPPSIVALINSTTEMICAVPNEQLFHLGVYWYLRSKEGQEVHFVRFSKVTQKEASGDSRFDVSKEVFQNRHILKIRGLRPSDSGSYHCAVSQSLELLLGQGTELSVVRELPAPKNPTMETPKTKKKSRRCSSSGKPKPKGISCSELIWAPLVGCAALLTVFLAVVVRRFQRLRRRRQYFRKQALK
uniref:Ig-like domain-containing protein n=1 Tax=Sphenodon punctatus TaxID=8508 RepID=A0A8D0L3P6_SPHPU